MVRAASLTVLLSIAAWFGASGCTSHSPASDDPPLAQHSASSQLPLANPPARPPRPWGYDGFRFAPDDHPPEHVKIDDAASASAFISEVSPERLTPLVFSARAEALCEIAEVIQSVPHGAVSVALFGEPSRADPACLARLDPSYLSFTVGGHYDNDAAQRAFFALARAVPKLRGLGYYGLRGTVHPRPTLSRHDLDSIDALRELQAVALMHIELTPAAVMSLAQLPGLRSLELDGPAGTPELLRVLAGETELWRFTCKGCLAGDEGMAELANFPALQVLVLPSAEITDAGMKHLAELPELEVLDLSHNLAVTNAGVAHLAGLVHMRRLWLNTVAIDSGAIPHLRALTELEVLHLEYTGIGDANLEVVGELTQLRELGLAGTKIGSVGVSRLGGLQRLERLGLDDTEVDSEALVTIGKLVALRELELSSTSVAGELQRLAALTRLEQLDLQSTSIDDAALRRLPTLPQLRRLDASFTSVSDTLALELSTDTLRVIIAEPFDCSG
jgi:hypothetical protein